MKLLGFISLSCLLFAFHATAQTPTPTPANSDDGDIVKISTNLIQIDVNVLDKKGNQVTGLKPEDFEVRENGKLQKITNFSYIAVSTAARAEAEKNVVEPKQSRIPPVPVKLRPEQVRRTMVLLVDDLGLSFGNVFWVKEALKKFVNEQMQPDDLVAIMRTGSGVGALQQFTTDKRLLLAAISKIKWNAISRRGISGFDPIRPTTKDLINGKVDQDGNVTNSAGNERDKESEKKENAFRDQTYTIGTLGTIRHIVAGLNMMPGRKGIILFSDGLSISLDVQDQMKRLVDLANRAGVVINTIDAKGLDDAAFMGPENDTRGMSFEQIDAAENDRREEFRRLQDGLSYLAYETGGRIVKNSNDINLGIERILRAENGYYLIAYQPDENSFDPKASRFNKLEVKVSRREMSVRYRSGFFGISDSDLKASAEASDQKVATALTSPFASKDIETRLTSIFANDPKVGNFCRALLHIDTRSIDFSDQPDGTKKMSLDIHAYLFGPDGKPVSSLTKNYTFAVRAEFFPRVLEKGVLFRMNVPISKPGAYQLRIAVQDTGTRKIGSASQFIEIPDLGKGRLALSGIIVQNTTLAQMQARAKQNSGPAGDTGASQNGDSLTATTTRVFKRGSILIYDYAIYNAKTTPDKGSKLETHVRLFHDGKLLYESPPVPVNTDGQADLTHIEDRGVLTIGSNLAPGDYVLQLVTTDSFAKEKNQIAAQSIDFEVVE